MIAVFYSFKGGVGRSMAMANVADLLARSGLRVLMVDFDMEAPGIEQYFPVNQSKARNHPGLLDLLLCYKQTVSLAATDEGPSFREIERFILPVYEQLPESARLDLMPAGMREGAEQLAQYAHNLRTFDWQDFISNWGGDRFFEWLRRRITELYDVVLVDSRTGVTEMGGICAYQLADTILMFSGANLQSIQGTQNLVRNFALPGVQLLRQYRPLDVVVVPARIEHSDEEMLRRIRERFATAFGDDTPRTLRSAGLECWDLRIPYEPHYAFEEQVVTDPSRALTERPIADSFRRIVHCLAMLADDGSALAQCREAKAADSEVTAPIRYDPTRRLAAFDAVFLYSRRDRRAVDLLVQGLENKTGLRVWADWSTAPGAHWATQLEEALLHARCIVVTIGNGGIQGPLLEEVNFVLGAAVTKSEIRLIPVFLPNTEDAETRMPQRVREAQAVDFRRGSYEENFLQLADRIRGVGADLAPERPVVDFGEPYVGSQPFTEHHTLFFAGRDAALQELLRRVRTSPLIGITGPAGCGKSSLVQAGLIPALRKEKETAWKILALRVGNDPIASAAALAEAIDEKAVADAIYAIETSVAETARVILDALVLRSESIANSRWLLFVDNIEELLAPGRDPKRSTLFVQLLVALGRATGGHLCVLAACRDDALSALQTAHPVLADLIQNNRVELTPMTLEDLRQAIEQPAQRAGYIFEPGLLNRLLGDFAPDTRSLALLQIVLLELHRHAREGVLTNEAYDRLGGLAGFLVQRGESMYASLSPEERQAARWLMLRLVQTSIDGKGTRRRAKLSDFNSAAIPPPMIAWALGKLRDLGLIVTTTEGGDAAVELASENLLQGWPRLKAWVDEHSENLLMRGEIETTTQTTGAAPLPPAMLDRIAAEWVSGTLRDVLNGRELEYILRSARASGRIDLFETGETPMVERPAVGSRVFVAPELGKKAVKRLALSNLPERNQFFTGRETVLAQLQEALAERGRVALRGLGGVGKTQTAVEYAHRHLDEYVYTFWATAHSREALVSAYLTIAGLLKLPECDAKDQALAVDAVKRWLSSQEGWLLILDNANDLGTAREFIPQGKNGHVILTTRARAVGAVARVVKIKTMDTEEGGLFLLRRAKYVAENAALDFASEADQANAIKIATQLDGLPLALDQAAAYIEETGCGLADYLELYQQHASELLGRRGELASDHSVARTWILSFENIEKANPAAAELLRFCAFLDPDVIPEELFVKGAPELGPVLGTIVRDALALDSVFSELSNYSLVQRDANARTLEIHRLVQEVLKQGMDENTQRLWAERAVRAVKRAFPYVEFSNWPLCGRLLPQAQACAALINKWSFEFPDAARLLNDAGFYLSKRGRYTDIEPLYQRARAIWEKALGPEHPDVATSLNNLAELYRAQGRYTEAEPLSKRALAIREKAFGPEHPDVAHSLNNLALLYLAIRRYTEAEPLSKRALAIREKTLGPAHPDVAASLYNLAKLYRVIGRYIEAEPLSKRALAIREKTLGPAHPNVANSLNNLALLYYDQGRYAEAEPLFERALAIWEEALGPEHPKVATCLESYASLLRKSGRPVGEAEPLIRRALAIDEKSYGPDHPNVAIRLNNLGGQLQATNRLSEAELLMRRALAIDEKSYGPDHPNVAIRLNNLAALYRDQGQYAKAEPLYQRAIELDLKYALMGGNLSAKGATFKVWAPGAQHVYLNGTFGGNNRWEQDTDPSLLLQKDNAGYWSSFMPGAGEGDPYKFYVVGTGGRGYKRDPYARELSFDPPFPSANCLLRNPGLYPWHDQGFVTPDYSNMIIYQLHVGTFYSKRPGEDGTFLDVVEKIEYLAALGITVLELLPIDEFETQNSQGHNGSDLFSPDTRYGVSDQQQLAGYLATVNRLLEQKQLAGLTLKDLAPVPNQLKVLVDLCHLYGIAVVFDVVYNHAGGFDGDDASLYFWDRCSGNNDSSLYFTSHGWAGGLSFALWKQEVRQFLIDNAAYFRREFHVDGFRYDDVSVLVALNQGNGWKFCQDLTNTVRSRHDRAIQIAEFWPVNLNIVKSTAANGAGFDATEHDALRLAVRQAIGEAGGGSSHVNMNGIAADLYPPGFPEPWKAVSCVESRDEVFSGRSPRIPRLADGSNSRSFHARSRSRVATGLLLTAPAIPQLFMGQEFLEDKQWDDNPSGRNRINWEGLTTGEKSMLDFLRFTQDLIRLRRNQPAIRSTSIRVFHVDNDHRILAFHRWLEGEGRDVVVVVSLNDRSQYNYSIGFPRAGRWVEVFNSDVYDNWVNPSVTGNRGQIFANDGPMHGFANSAVIVIPPNSIVVFGD